MIVMITNPTVYPGAPELCDGLDNNCDTQIDEGLSTDADGDGHYAVGSCLSPADDCDDSNAAIYPGAMEVCDGLDNDCDGLIDDEDPSISGQAIWYADADGDGYGDAFVITESCSQPLGYVSDNTDCDDEDSSINPGAIDIPDNDIDEDCDGIDSTENDCTTAISGNLNINPSMSSNHKFIMETPSGTINMNTLAAAEDDYSYTGEATSIKIRAKGNGKTLTVNGVDITLAANTRYEFTGDMLVTLVNNAPNNCANPNGFWWIDISGAMVCSFPDAEEITSCSNSIFGILNINPSMASNNMFTMETANGTIDMELLSDEGADYTYSGDASSVKIMVKGWGKLLWINGTCVWLQSNTLYEFTGDLYVCLNNSKSWGNWNKAKGHWWISISGSNICMTPEIDLNKDNANIYTDPTVDMLNDLPTAEVYPNPFSDFATIDFTIEEKSNLQIIIIDAQGRMIKNIHATDLAPGNHSVTWDGTNNDGRLEPNGIYLVQIITANSTQTLRVILNK